MRRLSRIATALLCATLFSLSANNCRSYNPALYPSYDVLNPGDDVRANPLGWVSVDPVTGELTVKWEDTAGPYKVESLVIVNRAFMLWVYELQQEIETLRGSYATVVTSDYVRELRRRIKALRPLAGKKGG